MADYVLRGTEKLLKYVKSLNSTATRERMASAIGEDVLPFAGSGKSGSAWVSTRYSEARAQALAGVVGTSVANITANGGQEIVG